MAYRCEVCGKSKQFGHNVSFSQRKTKRVFKPNLQTKRFQVGTNKVTVKVCAQCLRRLKKEQADKAAATTAKVEVPTQA